MIYKHIIGNNIKGRVLRAFGADALSQLINILSRLILIPLLSPLFFAAVELSTQVMTLHRIDLDSGWMSLLIGLDVLYVVLGLNLFQYVIRE